MFAVSRYILNVTTEVANKFENKQTIQYQRVDIIDQDNEDIFAHFNPCIDFISP